MKALLLAAGLGTRLKPLTNDIPKCLVPINGKPLLEYWLELLFSSGIERVIINTHWLHDRIDKYLCRSIYRDLIDMVYEPELLGTGGTILKNKHFFGGADFLVAHADNLTNFDVVDFIAQHYKRPAKCEMTMLAFKTDNPSNCGIVELDSNMIVQAFHEKVQSPPGNLANAAVYILTSNVMRQLEKLSSNFIDFSVDIIPQFVGRIFCIETQRYLRDIGSIESLVLAEKEFICQGSSRN